VDGGSARRNAVTCTGQNKQRQTSMPRVGFEPMIPGFEWAKTVHALDLAATVTGCIICQELNIPICCALRQMDPDKVGRLGLSRRWPPSVFSPGIRKGKVYVWGVVQDWSPSVLENSPWFCFKSSFGSFVGRLLCYQLS
jgi:hypothetical protein